MSANGAPAAAPRSVDDLGLPRRIVRALRKLGIKEAGQIDPHRLRLGAPPADLTADDVDRVVAAFYRVADEGSGGPAPPASERKEPPDPDIQLNPSGTLKSVIVEGVGHKAGKEIVFDRHGTREREPMPSVEREDAFRALPVAELDLSDEARAEIADLEVTTCGEFADFLAEDKFRGLDLDFKEAAKVRAAFDLRWLEGGGDDPPPWAVEDTPYDRELIAALMDWLRRKRVGDVEPRWKRWSEFAVTLEDGSPVRVVYDPRSGDTHPRYPGGFELHGPMTETGFRSSQSRAELPVDGRDLRTYAEALARHVAVESAAARAKADRYAKREAKKKGASAPPERPPSTRRSSKRSAPRPAPRAGHLEPDGDPDLRAPAGRESASDGSAGDDEPDDEHLEAAAIGGDGEARKKLAQQVRAETRRALPNDRRGLMDDPIISDAGVWTTCEVIPIPMPRSKATEGFSAEIRAACGNDGLWYEGISWKMRHGGGGYAPSAVTSEQHRTRKALIDNACELLAAQFRHRRAIAAAKTIEAFRALEAKKPDPDDPSPDPKSPLEVGRRVDAGLARAKAEVESLKAAAPELPEIGDWRELSIDELDLNEAQRSVAATLGAKTAGELDDLLEGRRKVTPTAPTSAGKPAPSLVAAFQAPFRAALEKAKGAEQVWNVFDAARGAAGDGSLDSWLGRVAALDREHAESSARGLWPRVPARNLIVNRIASPRVKDVDGAVPDWSAIILTDCVELSIDDVRQFHSARIITAGDLARWTDGGMLGRTFVRERVAAAERLLEAVRGQAPAVWDKVPVASFVDDPKLAKKLIKAGIRTAGDAERARKESGSITSAVCNAKVSMAVDQGAQIQMELDALIVETERRAAGSRRADSPEEIIRAIDLRLSPVGPLAGYFDLLLEDLGLEVPDQVVGLLVRDGLRTVEDVLARVGDGRALADVPGMTDARAALFAEQLAAHFDAWASVQAGPVPDRTAKKGRARKAVKT